MLVQTFSQLGTTSNRKFPVNKVERKQNAVLVQKFSQLGTTSNGKFPANKVERKQTALCKTHVNLTNR